MSARIAHAAGLLSGNTGHRKRDPWQQHLLKTTSEDDNVRVFRVEFQDGTHKAPTQDYHGSGRPHIHVLVFASREAMESTSLPAAASASLPKDLEAGQEGADAAEDILAAAVEGSQLDRSKRSGWPLEEGANRWEGGALKLQHTADDKARGLRPYFVDIMEALRCHQDLQFADDDGALRAYVAKYVSKFSDSNQDERLNDAAQGNSIAATVLCRYKPCEPEMVLDMFGANFRQWHASTESGGKRDFLVPWPEKARHCRSAQSSKKTAEAEERASGSVGRAWGRTRGNACESRRRE